MIPDEVESALLQAGCRIAEREELTDGHGWRLRIVSPEIVNVYGTGKVTVQGKPYPDLAELLGASQG